MTTLKNAMGSCCSSHQKESISCSCCSPIWRFLMGGNVDNLTSTLPASKPCIPILEDRIFRVGKGENGIGYIQTLAGGNNVAVEAIGIRNGLIVATGTYDEVKAQFPDINTEQTIKNGQTLIPGMFEPHLHIIPTAIFNMFHNVSPFDGQYLRENYTREWILAQLESAANSTKDKDAWVMGREIDPSLMQGDKEFNATILDGASKIQPIFLMNASMHVAYINTPAINLLKTNNVPLPNDTGILQELAELQPVLTFIASTSTLDQAELNYQIDKMLKEASARGVTYVLDAGVDPASNTANEGNPLSNQPDYLRSIAYDNCPVRIAGALAAPTLDEFNKKIEGKYVLNTGNNLFNLPFIKVLSDGSNQGLTGYQYTPYSCNENYESFNQVERVNTGSASRNVNDQHNVGIFNYGYPNEFDTLIKKIVDNGFPMMVHANGDHAVQRTVSAIKKAGVTNETKNVRRDRIEHASLLSDDILEKMQELGTSPSFLIGHVGYWGWVFQQTILGAEKTNLLDRCQTAISRHNMRITLHSDNSVTPLGPLRMMEQAITRIMEGAPKEMGDQVLNEVEQLTRFQALKAATYDAAWQCHADQWVGSLEVGKCADLVLLNESPLTYSDPHSETYSAKGMRDIKVLETWKGGAKVPLNSDNKA